MLQIFNHHSTAHAFTDFISTWLIDDTIWSEYSYCNRNFVFAPLRDQHSVKFPQYMGPYTGTIQHINRGITICAIIIIIIINLLLLLLLLKEVGSARLRESDIHLISSTTAAPQYQRIDRNKIKRKIEDNSRDRAA